MKLSAFRWTKFALALFLVTVLANCAEERPAIDRVQPNAMDKSYFGAVSVPGECLDKTPCSPSMACTDGSACVGYRPPQVWYYQRTVVDVPAANGFTFVGNTDYNGMMKIRWDIQEDFLYARRTTEMLKGASDKTWLGGEFEGEVVAAFRIEKHFDIVNAYNSTTGEQLNIIEENSHDRPWYERQYFRVDWSENKVHNYQLDFETQSVESVPYYVQDTDPTTGQPHRDAPHFAPDGTYFDVTSRLFAKAGTVELPPYGEIPLCWLYGEEFTECGAGEYSIRNSFLRLDPNRQYRPLPYKGKLTEVFGFFWTDQMVYDPQKGILVQGKERHLTRHNLWKQWWNPATGEEIPHAERELRPIVYHVNRDFPDDLRDIAQNVADQWNFVFVDAVESLGHNLNGRKPFILCPNNPVRKGDPTECGEWGNSPRLGDIRYSFMAYVPQYMTYGLLGLGPSNNDPETGEIISGMGYVYHHNNLAAFRTLEMIELLNGNKDPQKFIDGVDLSQWIDNVAGGATLPSRKSSVEDIQHLANSRAYGPASKFWDGKQIQITEADMAFRDQHGHEAWLQPHLDTMYQEGLLNGEAHSSAGRLAQLKGTYVEDLLLSEEILMAGGHQPNLPVTEDDKDAASIARGGLGKLALERAQMREQFAEKRNMYLAEMADDALLGLARQLKDEPLEEAYKTIRTAIYTAVISHEVGHSLGLMHNFGGSDDAINYHDGYWMLRDDGNIAPRLLDPITDKEIDGQIYNYAYSSVMDYAGRYTIDGLGIGKYDRAAILFGYAQKMEVFNDIGNADAGDLVDWYESDGDVLSFGFQGPTAIHYTDFYEKMGSKLYQGSNRQLVDVADFNGGFATANVDGQTRQRVPYIYCSHSRANLGDNCLTRDYGADAAERMSNMLDDLNTWYITRNFPRGKIGVHHFGHVSRYYGRVYNKLKRWNDLYALYTELLPRFFEPDVMANFLSNPTTGWGTKTWGVQNAFNYLVQTLLAPDVGGYRLVPEADGRDLMTTGWNGPTLELDVSQGRFYSTNWSFGGSGLECGYMWSECLHHIGYYLDKIMAIEALTDTQTNFVARASPIDLRQWEVGYYNTFPEQIAQLNAAMLGGDWSKLGPYATTDATGKQVLAYPNYAGNLAATNASPVDPFATFTVQLYWQVLGLARFPDNFDQSFVEKSAIYVTGKGDVPDFGETPMVSFKHPVSMKTFSTVAYSQTEGDASAAEALIDRLQRLYVRSNYCQGPSCVEPSPPHSKTSVGADLMDALELVDVLSDLRPMMDFANPYSL